MARRQAQSALFSRTTASWKYSRHRYESVEKCRERRRRRIQLRRSRSCSSAAAAAPTHYLSTGITSADHDPRLSQNNPMPIFSTISSVNGNLCVVPELVFIGGPLRQPLHFFAVYHGHVGPSTFLLFIYFYSFLYFL